MSEILARIPSDQTTVTFKIMFVPSHGKTIYPSVGPIMLHPSVFRLLVWLSTIIIEKKTKTNKNTLNRGAQLIQHLYARYSVNTTRFSCLIYDWINRFLVKHSDNLIPAPVFFDRFDQFPSIIN